MGINKEEGLSGFEMDANKRRWSGKDFHL